MTSAGIGAQTLQRGLRVLSLIGEHPKGLRVNEITDATSHNRSAVSRILAALEAEGYVVRQDGVYRIGYKAALLATHAGTALVAAAHPILDQLAARVNATTALSVRVGDEVECLLSVEPPASLIHVAYRAGLRHPLHQGASGRAVAASAATAAPDAVPAEIDEAGFAVSHGEIQPGAVGVAAPVHGTATGAGIAVIGLDESITSPSTTGPLVEAAAELTRRITGVAPETP